MEAITRGRNVRGRVHHDADPELEVGDACYTAARGAEALDPELDDARSPVRLFLQERYAQGLRDVQRQYRAAAPPLQVPSVSRADADPGTVGTAADWLLRFLLHPQPDIHLAVAGAVASTKAGIMVLPALAGMAGSLNVPMPARPPDSVQVFTGPSRGSHADPALLARSCWALALLTEVFRAGPAVAALGPLGAVPRQPGRLSGRIAGACTAGRARSAVRFRRVFETALLPRLTLRTGRWAVGPTFAGSDLIKADADLIAAGLLLELKTPAKSFPLGLRTCSR